MSSTATSFAAPGVSPKERLDVLFDEWAELTGQRNAIDGRLVDIAAEIDRDGLAGSTGCRSISALVAWKAGMSDTNAHRITTIAQRSDDFPLCTAALRKAACPSIKSASSSRKPPTAPTPTTSNSRSTPAVDHPNRRRGLHHLARHLAE